MRAFAGLLAAVSAAAQVVVVDTARAGFAVAPLSAHGDVLRQAKDGRRAIGGKPYRYRAFVTVDADPSALAKAVGTRAISVVRVAGLPLPGAVLSLEAVTAAGHNPNGLLFLSGQPSDLAEKSFDQLDKVLHAAGIEPAGLLQLTCFSSTLDHASATLALAARRYPSAARNLVQILAPEGRTFIECEGVAQARQATGYLNPSPLPTSPNYTQAVGADSPRLVWSGLHRAADCSPAAVRSAFAAMAGALGSKGASVREVAMSQLYPFSKEGADLIRSTRFDFYDRAHPPGSTMVNFPPQPGVCVAVEAIAPQRSR